MCCCVCVGHLMDLWNKNTNNEPTYNPEISRNIIEIRYCSHCEKEKSVCVEFLLFWMCLQFIHDFWIRHSNFSGHIQLKWMWSTWFLPMKRFVYPFSRFFDTFDGYFSVSILFLCILHVYYGFLRYFHKRTKFGRQFASISKLCICLQLLYYCLSNV